MNDLLHTMLKASGGLDRWQATKSILFHGQMGGFMVGFKTILNQKMYRNIIRIRDLEVFVHQQKMIFYDWPSTGYKGVFENGHARIESSTGQIISERKNCRSFFLKNFGLNNMIYWDILDFTYFIGYMMWNYFTAPYLFTLEGVRSREIESIVAKNGQKFRVLEVTFPPHIHTHCQTQLYLVDERGLNVEMRYHVDISGIIQLKFHNFITRYENIDGLQLPMNRRIFFNWDTFYRKKRQQCTSSLPIWGTTHRAKLIKKENTPNPKPQHPTPNF